MRMRTILPADCARACEHLSLRLDSELSEFESVLLEAHLTRCADCRAFGESITGLTKTLRTVPAEQPTVSFQVQRPRSRMDALLAGSLRVGSAAAAIAVVALSGLVALHGSTSAIPGGDVSRARAVLNLHERQMQQLDNFGLTQRPVPRGLAAAESDAIRVAAPQATSSRRLQGRR
jgi:predicted anti-sigma-YlaC factor YlaD